MLNWERQFPSKYPFLFDQGATKLSSLFRVFTAESVARAPAYPAPRKATTYTTCIIFPLGDLPFAH